MGYTTDFEGGFEFSRPLTSDEKNYITKFNNTRRMKRNVEKLYELFKGEHGNPFLPKKKPTETMVSTLLVVMGSRVKTRMIVLLITTHLQVNLIF